MYRFLRQSGGQLLSLRWHPSLATEEDLIDIARYCTRLQKLKIVTPSRESLDDRWQHLLNRMMQLSTLKIFFFPFSDRSIAALRTYFLRNNRLQRLVVRSFGNQLFCIEQLRQIHSFLPPEKVLVRGGGWHLRYVRDD